MVLMVRVSLALFVTCNLFTYFLNKEVYMLIVVGMNYLD